MERRRAPGPTHRPLGKSPAVHPDRLPVDVDAVLGGEHRHPPLALAVDDEQRPVSRAGKPTVTRVSTRSHLTEDLA